MDIELLEPQLLWTLALLPILFLAPRKQVRRGHIWLRFLVLALLILGLARPVTLASSGETTIAYVHDASPSLTSVDIGRTAAELEAAVEEPRANTRAAVTTLDGSDGSPIGAALQNAALQIPEGSPGAVVLWSDGLATEPDWRKPLDELKRRGIPVSVRALGVDVGDLAVHSLDPGLLIAGRSSQVQIVTGGPERNLILEGGPVGTSSATLARSTSTKIWRVGLEIEPSAPGFWELTATAEGASDTRPGNESLTTLVAVQAPPRALYLGDRVQGAASALAGLIGPGFQIDEGVELPTDVEQSDIVEALRGYELVILDDRPADQVPEVMQRALAEAVRDQGLGLFVSGGRASFAAGGYHETPIAEILPVELLQNQEKRDPSTTLAIIIDTSGSMGGMRVILAKEVARLAMKRLLPHDKIGIVEFYGAKRWAAPIQPASNRIELERALNRLDAGGGTVILPAIEEAFYGLQNVDTRTKHVLILTDGGVEQGAFEPLVRRMADKGINVSTVLVGPEAHSEFLVNIANWGKGRFYSVPNRFNLPEIILKQPASAKLSTYRDGVHQLTRQNGDAWWGDLEIGSGDSPLPPLAGYVQTKQRPGAENPLVTTKGEHPVLASWHYGLGRVTAFLTEPTGPGTEPWQSWEGYGEFLARALERTAADGLPPFEATVKRAGRELSIRLEAREWTRARVPAPTLRRLDDRGDEHIPLQQRAPGVYTASVLADPSEALRFAVTIPGHPRELLVAAPVTGGKLRERHAHRFTTGFRPAALAQATGGKILDSAPGLDLPLSADDRIPRATEWWPLCVLLALLAYLADIFYRRLGS